MIPRHTIRGRREISYIATTDIVAVLLTITMLVVRLHDNDFYDIMLLLTHIFAHTFTCILAFIILKCNVASSETMRLLIILYALVAIADVIATIWFICLFALHNHDDSIDVPYAVLRIAIGILFIGIDLSGAFYVDLTYSFLDSLVYVDSTSHILNAAQTVAASKNYTEIGASGGSGTGRINSVHLTITKPTPRTMSSGYNNIV